MANGERRTAQDARRTTHGIILNVYPLQVSDHDNRRFVMGARGRTA